MVDEAVACGLIALLRSTVAHVEVQVPDADPVHGHELGTAPETILNVVISHEDGHGEPILLDGGHRDYAIPPCSVLLLLVIALRHIAGNVKGLVVHDVVKDVHPRHRLHRVADAISAHEAHLLPADVGLIEVHHSAGHERLAVLVVGKREEVEGPEDAFWRHDHVVVHKQDVGGLGLLLHRLDHAAGKPASTAGVVVGMNGDAAATEGIRIEGAAVVHDMHLEVTSDGIARLKDVLTHQPDVAGDVVFLLEGGSAEGELDVANIALLDLGKVVGVPYLDGTVTRDGKRLDGVLVTGGEVDVERDPLVGGGDRELGAVDCLGVPAERVRPSLCERGIGTLQLQMEAKLLGGCVLLPLANGDGIEEGREVMLARPLQCPGAVSSVLVERPVGTKEHRGALDELGHIREKHVHDLVAKHVYLAIERPWPMPEAGLPQLIVLETPLEHVIGQRSNRKTQ